MANNYHPESPPDMTDDATAARLTRIENRQEGFEQTILTRLQSIDENITLIRVADAKHRQCPSPGLCLILEQRIEKLESRLDTREEKITNALMKLQLWQAGIVACLGLTFIVVTFFGPAIRHMLGISQ